MPFHTYMPNLKFEYEQMIINPEKVLADNDKKYNFHFRKLEEDCQTLFIILIQLTLKVESSIIEPNRKR